MVFLQQGNYGSTHMLQGALFIYLCFIVVIALMIAVPILKMLSKIDACRGKGRYFNDDTRIAGTTWKSIKKEALREDFA